MQMVQFFGMMSLTILAFVILLDILAKLFSVLWYLAINR
jgi:hypothetical protein